MALTKSEVLAKYSGRRTKDLDCGLRIRSLTSAEMRDVRLWMLDKKGEVISANANALDVALFAKCVVNGDAEQPMFTLAETFALDGGIVSHVGRECRTFTGFDKDADFRDIEAAAKNSSDTSGN